MNWRKKTIGGLGTGPAAVAGAPGQLPAAPTLGKVTQRWPSPGTAPQPLRFQWNLNPVGNLSHFLLLPPQKRRGTAGHLSFPNKSHPTSLPGMGRPVAEARPPPRPQPEGKGRGLWRPEGRPRGARTPGRPRSPAASSVGGRAEQPGGGPWPCPPGLLCAAKF